MKTLCLILICFVYKYTFCQSDSIITQTGPASKRKLERAAIINGFLIADTAKSATLLKNLESSTLKRKFYSGKKSFRRWRIIAPDGILFYRTRKNIIIDITTMRQLTKTE
jgi:hypothetical protein